MRHLAVWKQCLGSLQCSPVLAPAPGKLKNKADTAWHTGIWLGKDTEAQESIVQCEGTVLKVRSVKRVIPSKQWNTDLHKLLNSTPWDPKGKDTTDTDFVLPPSMPVRNSCRDCLDLESSDEVRTVHQSCCQAQLLLEASLGLQQYVSVSHSQSSQQ